MSAWRSGNMPVSRFIEFAKEVGADGVEILDAFLYEPGVVRDHLPPEEVVKRLIDDVSSATAKTGMRIHAVAVTNDFSQEDNSRLVVERDKIRLGVDLAKTFGAPVVRVFSGNPMSSDAVDLVRYRTIDALKDLSDASVALALENHGNVFCSPARLESILEPLADVNVGLCFDIGNFLLADVNPVTAAEQLPAPVMIHVKDFRQSETGPYRSQKGTTFEGCRLGEGVVPIEACLRVLLGKLDGRPINIDLELECGDDGVAATTAGIQWLRNILK